MLSSPSPADVDFTQCGDYLGGGNIGILDTGFFTGCSFASTGFTPALSLNPAARLALQDCNFAPLTGACPQAAASRVFYGSIATLSIAGCRA